MAQLNAVNSEGATKSRRGTEILNLVELKDSTPEAPHHRFRYRCKGFAFMGESGVVDGKFVVTHPWGSAVRVLDEQERVEIEAEVRTKLIEALKALDVNVS